MIAIIDYGVGNLFSLKSSLAAVGAEAKVTSDPDDLRDAGAIVLPGVGAFADAASKLRCSPAYPALMQQASNGKPLLGICLGMQLLFDRSYEFGKHPGLSLIPGEVRAIAEVIPAGLKIPHIGWNALTFTQDSPLFKYISEGDHVYFVHSFAAMDCIPFVTAQTDYGAPLTACVRRNNIYGCQFHPEKSGPVGLNILRAFCELGGPQC